MAETNNFKVNIIVNNQIKEIETKNNQYVTYLENKSNYEIQLSNNNNKIVDAYLKIDGKKMGAYSQINKWAVISRKIFSNLLDNMT